MTDQPASQTPEELTAKGHVLDITKEATFTQFVRRPDHEIDEVMNAAADAFEATTSQYAQGVTDGIMWLLGQAEDRPVHD